MENKIYIFTDGNCKSNGKKGSKGGYGVFFTDDQSSPFHKLNTFGVLKEKQTNQVAELTAVNVALKIVLENISIFNKPVEICSDSAYTINCLTVWYKNWIRNGWKNSKGEEVKNQLIIQDTLDVMAKLAVLKKGIKFRHIRAHQRPPPKKDEFQYFLWNGNDRVDTLINEILI